MQIGTTSPRTSVMARWIILLALVALALGAATFVLARSIGERAATAELSFYPDAAYIDDFSLTHARHPAVAAAQSILTDSEVLDLLYRAGVPAADAGKAVGEFRSGLDLKEPSLETLQVRDYDHDPRRACAITNAVAAALEEWAPAVPTPAASKRAAAARPAARAAAHAAPQQDPLGSAYSTLADLEGQLASVDERLGVLVGHPTSAPLYPAPLTAAQDEQRRRLEAQLADAHRKLDDLRAQIAGGNPLTETAERRITELQQELAAFPMPASASSQGPAAIGTASILAQLRVQRGDLVSEIAEENRSIVRLRAHPAEQPKPTRAPPAQVAPAAPIPAWQNPFRILRLARVTPRILARPARLAIGISVVFLAAAAFGVFLYWRRETHAAPAADTVQGGIAFTLVPPMPVAEGEPEHGPVAMEPESAEQAGAAEPGAAEETIATEPEAEWEAVAREPEDTWESVAREPENGSAPGAAEPEDAWEVGGREPEDVWEPGVTEPVPSEGEERVVQATSALQIAWEGEVAVPPRAACPTPGAEPQEAAPGAANVPVHRDAETAKTAEASRPEEQPETAGEVAQEPAAESAQVDARLVDEAQVDARSSGRSEDTSAGRDSSVGPSRGDAEWHAGILQALARTSVGQKVEAEHRSDDPSRGGSEWSAGILQALARTAIGQRLEAERGEKSNHRSDAPPAIASDAAEGQSADSPRPQESRRE
jgi:hypothetical protein